MVPPPQAPPLSVDPSPSPGSAEKAAAPRGARRQTGPDPKHRSRRAQGALTSIVLHAAALGLLSVWAIPHLKAPAEPQSAHLETSWTPVVRSKPQALAPAPLVPEAALAPPLEEEWEPTWEPPSPEAPPKARRNKPDPNLKAARRFRTFTPQPEAPPQQELAPPRSPKATPPAPKPPRSAAPTQATRRSPTPHRKAPVALVAPRVEEQPRTAIPSRCRRRGHHGTARLLLDVDAKGAVLSSRVVSSAGCKRLDEAARKAGLRYRFHPGTQDGQASRWLVYVEIQFGTAG